MVSVSAAAQSVSVTTHHNNSMRTGWNPDETALTVPSVQSGRFDLQHSIPLDDQVDAQPLVVAGQSIAGQGVHTVVYVVSEGDTVYALDAFSGAVLLSRTLGAPVPQASLSSCPDNGPNIGIASTPAISVANHSLYLIAATYENSQPIYRLHALDLGSLQDVVAPTVIGATNTLADGTTYSFSPANSRQRSALLLSGSKIYAGFASYCDPRLTSRGWMLGWNVPSLTPLAANLLTNRLVSAPNSMFLSSIWMSGFGPATAGPNQPVYVVTGNSDSSGATVDGQTNLAESVLQLSNDLSHTSVVFTPSNASMLDQRDLDFGSGGAMLIPAQPGLTPSLLAAAGKYGTLYLLDRTHPGAAPLASPRIGPCFCGPSYFVGADGAPRLVTSGTETVTTWLIQNSASTSTTLLQDRHAAITSGQDGGFFTSISSNKKRAKTAIIWAVGRPTNSNPANVVLYAIDPTTGGIIYTSTAGTWPNVGTDADIVPTIANGQVYVASNRELAIFGLGSGLPAPGRSVMLAARAETNRLSAASVALRPGEHLVFGTVQTVAGSNMTLRKRTGALVVVDISRTTNYASPTVGRTVRVIGTYANDNVLAASSVHRAKRDPALWLDDR